MITTHEYQVRRHTLAERLPPETIALIPAGQESIRNGDAHYRFRQQSDFYYLTGFNEPDALLLVRRHGTTSESILFNRPKDANREQWDGHRLGQADACAVLGVDQAYSIVELEEKLPEYLAGMRGLVYDLGGSAMWDRRILDAWKTVGQRIRQGVISPDALYRLSPILSEMRLFKSESEIELMRRAADISVSAHQRAMRACRHLGYEYELEAELLYEFTRQGCRAPAYDSIVAAGENACILHYTENHQALTAGALVLVDAGGEYQNYAADITRTYPINGQFSPEQRSIYSLVLEAQQAGIALIRPGVSWPLIQETMVRVLTQGLIDLRILNGSLDELIETGAYKPFYMHNSGHWLGLDVHDCGAYRVNDVWRTLEPGMVLTVEPGLYLSGLPSLDERFRWIGVRIEDDILVTETGSENLSAALATAIDDVEACVRG